MNTVDQRVENQIQFWSLLGPFFLLVSATILTFKLSSHWYFPASALLGIPLCMKWKVKGMLGALAFLFLFSLLTYSQLNLDERYWYVGMALATAFSFIVLTLSLEEVESLVAKLQRESQSRLENFMILDGSIKQSEKIWVEEKNQLHSQIETLSHTVDQLQEEKQTFYRLAQLAKDEIILVREQYNRLKEELLYKKQQISQLSEKLEESEWTVQTFVNTDSEQKFIELQALYDQLNTAFHATQVQIKELSDCVENQKNENQHLQAQMEHYQKQEVVFQSQYQGLNDEKHHLNSCLSELKGQLERAAAEKEHMQQALKEWAHQHENTLGQELISKQELARSKQQLDTVQNEIYQFKASLQKIQEEKKLLEESFDRLVAEKQRLNDKHQQELTVHGEEVEQKNRQISEYSQHVERIQQTLEESNRRLQEIVQENQTLHEVAISLEEEKKRLETRLQDFSLQLGENGNSYAALFKQLKGQFQEKTETLNQTRKELFLANEELLRLQKEAEEYQLYAISTEETLLLNEYLRLLHAYETMEKESTEEIALLQDLVSHNLNP